jgi:hypothetical protein
MDEYTLNDAKDKPYCNRLASVATQKLRMSADYSYGHQRTTDINGLRTSTDYGRQRTTATDVNGLQLRTLADHSYGRPWTTATDVNGL